MYLVVLPARCLSSRLFLQMLRACAPRALGMLAGCGELLAHTHPGEDAFAVETLFAEPKRVTQIQYNVKVLVGY